MFTLILSVTAIGSYYFWKKYKEIWYFHYLLLSIAGIIMQLWQYIAKNILHLSGQVALINKYINLIFWIIVFLVLVLIFYRSFRKDKNKNVPQR
mgnify:CR=1 FL=1